MSWVDGYRFAEPMQDIRSDAPMSAVIRTEVTSEVAPGHPLSGVEWVVVARALPQDDVVLRVEGGAALVHLSWSGRPEPLPWPYTEFFETAGAFEDVIGERY